MLRRELWQVDESLAGRGLQAAAPTDEHEPPHASAGQRAEHGAGGPGGGGGLALGALDRDDNGVVACDRLGDGAGIENVGAYQGGAVEILDPGDVLAMAVTFRGRGLPGGERLRACGRGRVKLLCEPVRGRVPVRRRHVRAAVVPVLEQQQLRLPSTTSSGQRIAPVRPARLSRFAAARAMPALADPVP